MMTVSDHDSEGIGSGFLLPYRTGTYLVYDYDGKDTHFRRGDRLDPLLPASGSRQLDAEQLAAVLKTIFNGAMVQPIFHLVDLRQESHVFFDDRAVSWYADRDWANVRQPLEWINADERGQLTKIAAVPRTHVFSLQKEDDGRVKPIDSTEVAVKAAATEETVASRIKPHPLGSLRYYRFPVTDHCWPTDDVLVPFAELCKRFKFDIRSTHPQWVHFHCH